MKTGEKVGIGAIIPYCDINYKPTLLLSPLRVSEKGNFFYEMHKAKQENAEKRERQKGRLP